MFNTEIVQLCSARSHSNKVGGMLFGEFNNSLIFLVFSLVTSNISSSFEKCFPFISLSPSQILLFDVANISFKFLWYYQIYLLTLPPNINVLCTNKRSRTGSTHYTAYTQCQAHAVTHWHATWLTLWCYERSRS